ncbi:MAG: hypothetical protein LBP54_08435, partial [Campylobacteraceae bacterium]|nr:hypothetical protein [Campylobacteraceae bacterium]
SVIARSVAMKQSSFIVRNTKYNKAIYRIPSLQADEVSAAIYIFIWVLINFVRFCIQKRKTTNSVIARKECND